MNIKTFAIVALVFVSMAQFVLAADQLSASTATPTRQRIDWSSSIAVAVGQFGDALSTQRFLHNGTGRCTEGNQSFGPYPATWKLYASSGALVAGAIALNWLAETSPSKIDRWLSRGFSYVVGAIGAGNTIRNVHLCGF